MGLMWAAEPLSWVFFSSCPCTKVSSSLSAARLSLQRFDTSGSCSVLLAKSQARKPMLPMYDPTFGSCAGPHSLRLPAQGAAQVHVAAALSLSLSLSGCVVWWVVYRGDVDPAVAVALQKLQKLEESQGALESGVDRLVEMLGMSDMINEKINS
mmetsp:Transcript_26917/g.53011  ORF Transcript_26917/g.53011 Transcript_26917/m.53011 type:complete len:154 (-) Transcript_26917:318-779(-)